MNDKEKEKRIGKPIIQMVERMKRFVFPPSMDFVHRDDVDPFAMYVFEFTHTLSQQDIADIWQNVSPQIARTFEESEATIQHDLLAHELLGGGVVIGDAGKKKGPALPEKVRWMVFKVKQRAKTNYYDKIIGETSTTVQGTNRKNFRSRRLAEQAGDMLRPAGFKTDVSYNWPYDFFSLVELVKIDAEVTLADIDLDEKEQIVVKRGRRAIETLPPNAQQRIGNRNRGGSR